MVLQAYGRIALQLMIIKVGQLSFFACFAKLTLVFVILDSMRKNAFDLHGAVVLTYGHPCKRAFL